LKSPCINLCQMDPGLGVCIGCCRTLDEIAGWGQMSERQQERAMAGLAERRAALNIPDVSVPPLA
jgi:uncharacterized protein